VTTKQCLCNELKQVAEELAALIAKRDQLKEELATLRKEAGIDEN
jgi:hypothetical protein